METRQIRELAHQFSAEQLEACLAAELDVGENPCDVEGPVGDVVSTLAEAEFVRVQVDQGVPLHEAIRELARRMRAVQRGTRDVARKAAEGRDARPPA